MTTLHTPGPWKAQKDCRSYRNTGIITDGPYAWGIYGSYRIALMTESESWIPEAEVEANARLIAKAPEMAELLDRARTALDFYELWMFTHSDPGKHDTTYPFGLDTKNEIVELLAELKGNQP